MVHGEVQSASGGQETKRVAFIMKPLPGNDRHGGRANLQDRFKGFGTPTTMQRPLHPNGCAAALVSPPACRLPAERTTNRSSDQQRDDDALRSTPHSFATEGDLSCRLVNVHLQCRRQGDRGTERVVCGPSDGLRPCAGPFEPGLGGAVPFTPKLDRRNPPEAIIAAKIAC